MIHHDTVDSMSRRRRGLALAVALIVLTFAPLAHADQVDDHIGKLGADHAYKVRLSAALALSKSTDVRAIEALARALADDGEASIRNVAALALGKNVSEVTPAATRDLAIGALVSASSDRDSK